MDDNGTEAITDADVMDAVRRQARRVQTVSVAAAVLLTALYLIVT